MTEGILKEREMNKIKTKEVFHKAITMYKKQWKVLLRINIFQMLITYVILLATLLQNNAVDESVRLLAIFIRTILYIVSFYFANRLRTALILASKSAFDGDACSAKSLYKKAENVTWRYIGYRCLIWLMYILPLILVSTAMVLPTLEMLDVPMYVYLILYFLGGSMAFSLAVLFYYLLVLAVLCPKGKNIFGYSVKLVKKNVSQIICLVGFALLLPMYTYISIYILDVSQHGFWIEAIVGLARLTPLCLLQPFVMNLIISALYMTDDKIEETKAVNTINKTYVKMKEFDYLQ